MADDSDPYAVLMQPLASASTAPPTAPDPYDVLTKPLLADPGANISGYVAAGGRSTWGDVLQSIPAGLHGAAATAAGAIASTSDGSEEAYWRDIAHRQEQAVGASESAMTPAAQAPGFFNHPLVSLTEGAPGIAMLGIPTAAATAVGGPAAGAAVAGTLMGFQTRGDVYNRLTGEGIEPTSNQLTGATALGAATGLATEPIGALASKTVTSPLVRWALGMTGDAAVFGASGGAQEYGSQKAEIAAGKRTELDPSAILEQTKSGAEMGAGFKLFGGGHGGDESAKPAEDTHPANEPIKQPNIKVGTGRDGAQTGGEAHIERQSQQSKANETNKRDTGASPDAQKGTGPAPPPPIVDPTIKAATDAAQGKVPTPESKEQQDTSVKQSEVAQPPPPPSQGASEGAQTADTTGAAALPPPPPPSQPAPQPAAPAPVDPAVLAQQHAELLDAAHPRDAMIYPKGAEVPDITKFPESWRYGKAPMPKADGRTVVYDHSPRGSGWRREAIKAAAKDGTLEGKIEARAAQPPKPEFVAEAQPAAAAEGVKEAPAAAAEAATLTGEQPQAVQERSVEPRVAEEAPTPESKAPTEEKLGENKFGVSIWRKADGSYLKRYADGRPDVPTTEETAQLLLKAESYKPVKSESETIREAAQTEAEKLKLAREKVATLSTKDVETGEETAKPLPEAGARVLHAEDAEEKLRQEAQAKADIERGTAKPAVPPKRVAKPKEEQKAGKKSPEDVAYMKEQNATANDVVDRHQPKDEDARNREANAVQPGRGAGAAARAVVLMRAKAMLEDAAKNKYEFKGRAMHRIDPDVRHSNKALILYEAKLLVGKAGKVKIEDYARFLRNEDNLLHNGERAYTDVLGERSETGKERAAEIGAAVTERATGTGEEEAKATESADEAHERELASALEAKRTKGEELKEKERQDKVEREKEAERQEGLRLEAERVKRSLPAEGEIISPARAKAMDVERGAEEEPTRESKKTPLELQRERTDKEARERLRRQEEDERPVNKLKEGEGYTPVKARTTGFQIEKRRSIPGIKKQELPEIEVRAQTGKAEAVTPISSVTGKEAVEAHFNPSRYSAVLRPMMERLRDAVIKLAGDTQVHYISHDDMMRLFGAARGVWDGKNIYLNADRLNHDTALHEVFHAATAKAIMENLPLWRMMQRLRDEVEHRLPSLTEEDRKIIQPALDDPEEFLTYMMTNDKVQDLLRGIKISDELARDIGIAKWRKATMWNGMLHIIQRALGLEPRDVSAIEAAMALTEHTMWSRDSGMAMEAAGRLVQHQMQEVRPRFQRMEPPERDQDAAVRSHRETLARVRDIDAQVMKQFTKDKLINLSDKLLHGSMKIFSGTWLNDMHGHLFEDAKGKILDAINQARNKVSSTYHSLMDSDKDTITRGLLLDKMFASHMPAYSQLVNLSNTHNIHADRAAPTIPKNPEDAARKNWQGNKFYGEARAIYEHLPKELQQRYIAEKKFYMDKQAQSSRAIINKVMPLFKPPSGSTLDEVMARAHANDLTDEDWKHYESLNVDGALRKATNLMGRKDVYFNSQRDGRYVVTGQYDMPKGGKGTAYSGELLPDNKREFDTEKEAHDYVTGTKMHAVTHEVHYWTPTGGETIRVPSDFASSDPGKDAVKYQVRLERDNTQMATSKAEALRNRQAMEADGVKGLSGVLDKRDEKAWSKINTADQKAIERKIDGNSDMTEAEKQNLKEITRQLMLSGQGGMGAHMIAARKVAGAQYDNGLGLQSYARAANFHLARETHADEINEGMDRLEAHERANRTDDDATRRSIVANEYRNRVYGRDADTLNSKAHPLFSKIMKWAFVNFLMRPSHVLLSQIHPYVYSVPMMGGRHGYWKALQGQRQAMNDLGGTMHNLWEGTKAGYDVYKSGKERDIDRAVQMAHGVDPIRVMISRLKNPEEREFLNQMWQTQHLHSAFDASVFSGDGLDRTNAVIRQFTDAMEANNRLATALNAYRLEKSMHGDKAGALAYSRRVIEETHGVFSSTNTAPIFKNPIIRGAMQFRQQPMNLATMMYRNISKAAMGDTEAKWTVAYQLGTAALLGGMGGMPLDLPKLAGLASQAVGGPSPSDYADKLHRLLSEYLGETGANAMEEGLPGLMGPLGPSIGHRSGYDAGFFFAEPHSEHPDDFMSYAAKMAMGASGGMAIDWWNALQDVEAGKYERAGEGVLPGSLKDFLKSYRLATEGTMVGNQQVRPASMGDALQQFFGFSGVQRQQALAGHYALQKAERALPPTKGEQLKARHQEKTVLGVKVPKRGGALAQEYENAYGQ